MHTTSQQWEKEYSSKGIPSSFRLNPSGSVKEFIDYLSTSYVNVCHEGFQGNALDIGCGTGRNSIYLNSLGLKVFSMDFSETCINNISLLRNKEISPILQDVSKKWNIKGSNFDYVIDTFCFKHQIPEKDIANYKSELYRVLKPKGFFLLTLAGVEDGYYAQFLKNSPEPKRNVIVDPKNNIPSILYTKSDILDEFNELDLIDYRHKNKKSPMHGDEYLRSTHFFIFRKPK